MHTRILGPLALWLAAVASVAAIASLAIDQAGRQVTAEPIAAPLARDLAPTSFRGAEPTPDPPRTPAADPDTGEPRPDGSPGPSGSPDRTVPGSGSGSGPRSGSGSGAGSGSEGSGQGEGSPGDSPRSGRDGRPGRGDGAGGGSDGRVDRPGPRVPPRVTQLPVSSTYSTRGGRVRVLCAGSRITLDGGYAQPAANWAVTVHSTGPQRVVVVFDPGGPFALQVVATCVDGGPRFERSRIDADPDEPDGRGERPGWPR